MSNPYDPQTPARPEYFGGREHVLKRVRDRIDMAKTHLKSGGLLIYGHRGVGKTSLITKIISEISGTDENPSDILIISRRLARTTNDQELYSILNEELKQQVEKRKNLLQRIGSTSKNLGSVAAFGFSIDISQKDSTTSQYRLWRALVESLNNVKLIFIAIDDADFLSLEAIGELKTIVEEMSKTPILLTISGFMDFEEKLVDKYSPVARIFSGANFNIGRFSLEETTEVLNKPLDGENTKWTKEGIAAVHKVSGGYPYLVQCIASASYGENQTLTEKNVNVNIKKAVDIGKSWLDHEIPAASDQDVVSFARIAKLDKDILQSTEISKVGVSPPYIGRLVKLKILKQIRRGRYGVEKSPMIATFELLKRGLLE
ncbi:MAG TPA: ATP-binding protein [Candidatus Nanoarchaeia archaeon]|nr:ATP-binding protein [Candidatus Nanoarchaeia archaeon]